MQTKWKRKEEKTEQKTTIRTGDKAETPKIEEIRVEMNRCNTMRKTKARVDRK